MSELDALRRDNERLRSQLADAEQALHAFAKGDVDPVSVDAPVSVLLQAAQERLRRSERLLRSVFDGSLDALLLADGEGRCVAANSAAGQLFGVAREELLGRPVAELSVPALADASSRAPRVVTKQISFTRPDGARRVLEVSAVADVGPSLHLAVLRDVTERVGAEAALRKSEARFRAMIEKSHDGIALLAPDGRTLYQSPAVERLFGSSPELTRSLGWRDYVEPDQQARLAQALGELLSAPSAHISLEVPVRRQDGQQRWIDLTATNLLHDPDVSALVANFRDVTERRAIEHERDGFFRLSLTLLCVAGMDGRFRVLNPAWEATLGWSLEELSSRPWLDFVHPEDRAATELESAKVAAGRASVHFENRYRAKNGSYRRLRWAAVPSPDTQLIYATALDVTDERAIAARDKLLFSASPLAMWLFDGESLRFLEVNDAAMSLYGYSREEFLSMTLADVVGRDEAEDLGARLRETLTVGRADVAHRTHRTKSGQIRDVEVAAHRLDLGGRAAVLSVVIDVTERTRHQRELRASEERYRRIIENTSEGVWTYDANGTLLFVNRRAADMVGWNREAMVGKPIFAFMSPESAELARERLARPTQGISERTEVRLKRRDGTDLWASMHGDPLLDADGQFESAIALLTDITEQRQAAETLRRTEEQLRQAQKMEAIGSLAGGIAHDFNNLLSVILSYTSMSLDTLQAADPLRADIDEIHRAGLRAAELTRQLLAFSRRQILQPAVLDLNQALRSVDRMLGRLLGEAVELTILTAPNPAKVFADPSQIEQVVMNLVVNARDAMPNGGSITIETSAVILDEAHAALHPGVSAGSYVLLTVTDTGTGMDPATQGRIFEPFFTTKPQGRGTGLGLSTVYGIVQQSGGHVRVYSDLGHGTTFKVYLPTTERTPEEVPAAEAGASLRGTETILLVEDETPVRHVMRSILRAQGYHVLEAQNGGEAFLVCEEFASTIHLLVTDLVMPRMNGRQLANRLSALRPAMKVIFISGYTEDSVIQHGVLEAGINFLPKPVLPEALLRKVRYVLDVSRPLSLRPAR